MRFLLDPSNERVKNSIKKIVNKRGDMRNTALHHAARLWPGKTSTSSIASAKGGGRGDSIMRHFRPA